MTRDFYGTLGFGRALGLACLLELGFLCVTNSTIGPGAFDSGDSFLGMLDGSVLLEGTKVPMAVLHVSLVLGGDALEHAPRVGVPISIGA